MSRRFSVCARLVWLALLATLVAPSLLRGQQGPIDPIPYIFEAWVDPAYGTDPADPWTAQINDPSQPYKSLQRAIDGMCNHVYQVWHAQYLANGPNLNYHGIVYAMPGLYGEHGPLSSGDQLPIQMRERVHVQGMNARACVIRGKGVPNLFQISWPDAPQVGSHRDAEVLVNWTTATPRRPVPMDELTQTQSAWIDIESGVTDAMEMFDGFTLQGGDVQLWVGWRFWTEWKDPDTGAIGRFYSGFGENGGLELRGTVSNCVFDLRHNWTAVTASGSTVIPGPFFGVMLTKRYLGFGYTGSDDALGPQNRGYADQKFVISNNTFVFAEWGTFEGGASGWVGASRNDAVGIIDVTDPSCSEGGPYSLEPDTKLRGVGNAMVINNVFRTQQAGNQATQPMAMIGIDDPDTIVRVGALPDKQTNVFAPGRAGHNNANTANPTFFSQAVTTTPGVVSGYYNIQLWDCHPTHFWSLNCALGTPCPSAPLPRQSGDVHALILFDGTSGQGVDPAFVGEYVKQLPGVGLSYTDWRLLPGSRLMNEGYASTGTAALVCPLQFTMTSYQDSQRPPQLRIFDLDGEGYGNPRQWGLIYPGNNSNPDIGFDEVGSHIIAGSYSNDSNSHNRLSFINPTAAVGGSSRWVISASAHQGATATLKATQRGYASLPATNPPFGAWTVPPAVLTVPIVDSNLEVEFQSRYINFNNPPAGMPWVVTLVNVNYFPLNGSWGPNVVFSRSSAAIVDDEGASNPLFTGYFNTQVEFTNVPGVQTARWSNLQSEYR